MEVLTLETLLSALARNIIGCLIVINPDLFLDRNTKNPNIFVLTPGTTNIFGFFVFLSRKRSGLITIKEVLTRVTHVNGSVPGVCSRCLDEPKLPFFFSNRIYLF